MTSYPTTLTDIYLISVSVVGGGHLWVQDSIVHPVLTP